MKGVAARSRAPVPCIRLFFLGTYERYIYAGIICFDSRRVALVGRGRSRNGPRSDIPRHRRYWLTTADELPRLRLWLLRRGPSRSNGPSSPPPPIDRAAIDQETLVEKFICHYPAYGTKRLRIVNVALGIYTCVKRARECTAEDAEGFLRAVSSGHTCVYAPHSVCVYVCM